MTDLMYFPTHLLNGLMAIVQICSGSSRENNEEAKTTKPYFSDFPHPPTFPTFPILPISLIFPSPHLPPFRILLGNQLADRLLYGSIATHT
ncbi:hypothetical protein [Kamptonema sp. PCC 6506]|uniref:hypothetical protein n=1 Tax=Kamptonema sp. PCC 6506 TaxID=272129 RepID=UPI0012F4FA2C|nr:hypothetical protein [Kamptonema sp. PCC 6506]